MAYIYTKDGKFINCKCNCYHLEKVSTKKTIEIIADSGYKFDPDGLYEVTTDSFESISLEVLPDGSKLTYTPYDNDTSLYFYNTYEATKAISGIYALDLHLNGCINLTPIKDKYEEHEQITLELESISIGQKFDENSFSTSNIESPKLTINPVVDGSRATATITGYVVGNASINISTYIVKTINLSGSFENCTCNYSDNEEVTLSKPNLIITANSGYSFDKDKNYSCINPDSFETYTMELNEDATQLSIDVYNLDATKLVFNDDYIATQIIESFKVNVSTTNCKLLTSLKPSYTAGENITIKLQATNNCYFNKNSVLYDGLTDVVLNINENKITVTVTGKVKSNAKILVTAYENHYVHITGVISNAKCNYNDGEQLVDSKPNIIITANGGFYFNELNYEFVNQSTFESSSMVISDDKKTLSIYNALTLNGDLDLSGNYVAVPEVETLSSFTRLYSPTDEELNSLAKVRFQGSTEGGGINSYDTANYISALYKLPVPLYDSVISPDKSNIILGNFNSNVPSDSLTTYNYEIDYGSITVPNKYNNVYDFMTTECILHVPYFSKIYLPTEYVVGQTVSIKAVVDLYSGVMTVNTYSTFNNGIVDSQSSLIGINIPYLSRSDSMHFSGWNTAYSNVSDTAIIEVIRNIPYDVSTEFGKETVDFGTLGDYTGYVKVPEIILNCNATNEEKDEIVDILKEGVFINNVTV